jgi:hypothetical protein
MLLYGHLSSERRHWVDIEAAQQHFSEAFEVRAVQDFGALSMQEQAKEFNQAELLVLVHGGEMANVVFCREGAAVYEISCTGYSHLKGSINLEVVGIIHHVLTMEAVKGECAKLQKPPVAKSACCMLHHCPCEVEENDNNQGRLDFNIKVSAQKLAKRMLADGTITSGEWRAVMGGEEEWRAVKGSKTPKRRRRRRTANAARNRILHSAGRDSWRKHV